MVWYAFRQGEEVCLRLSFGKLGEGTGDPCAVCGVGVVSLRFLGSK
ncbi:hypothetical protein [Armatimonas sp.]|nr:hypothetical protein [Armatimonas sp.]